MLLLTVLCLVVAAHGVDVEGAGRRVWLNETNPVAQCLDGSSGAYYLFPATNSKYKDSWIIFLQGGGACVNKETCYMRSKTELGSSNDYPATIPDWALHGALSRNCTHNPEFCEYNLAAVRYCDAFIYTGARTDPVDYKGTKLYFRGAEIRRAALQSLATTTNFSDATSILFTGCSAGALATFLHVDTMAEMARSLAPKAAKIRAAPLSGFFLEHSNLDHEDP